ncbi:protoporphyrinogen oxidase [Nesterenkonia flava]
MGGGVAGLTVAWQLARAGHSVTVYEAGEQLGGAVAPQTLAGVRLDAGAEAFATRTPAVRELIDDLGLSDQVVSPTPAPAWLQLPDRAAPLPATGLLGIPADPGAEDVRRLLGDEAAERALEDLHLPMTWRPEDAPSLGEVVRARMGEPVLHRLVSPITSGVHSAAPDDLDVRAAHPKLFTTMLEQGSLARAVALLRAQAPAGSAVQSLRGGMNTLVSALEIQLRTMGARLLLKTPVESLAAVGHAELRADHVVLAVDGPGASRLAAGWLDGTGLDGPGTVGSGPGVSSTPEKDSGAQGSGVALVTLVLHAPDLDGRPRGTGMLVAPSVMHVAAKAMTHVSAKWDWAARALIHQLGPGHHVVRLSYGRITDSADTLGYRSRDEDLLAAAMDDVPQLFGLSRTQLEVLDASVVRWDKALPGAATEQRTQAQALRAALAERRAARAAGEPAFYTVGTWFAGTGLAQVIPDARNVAAQVLGSASS